MYIHFEEACGCNGSCLTYKNICESHMLMY